MGPPADAVVQKAAAPLRHLVDAQEGAFLGRLLRLLRAPRILLPPDVGNSRLAARIGRCLSAAPARAVIDCSARCARSARIALASRLVRRRSGTKSMAPRSSSLGGARSGIDCSARTHQ